MTAPGQVFEALMRIEGKLDDLLQEQPERPQDGRLVDAGWIAKAYGVRREWVYRNQRRLGAKPLGSGVRPRLLFDPAVVDRLIRGRAKPAPDPPLARHRCRRPSSKVSGLLPTRRRRDVPGSSREIGPWFRKS